MGKIGQLDPSLDHMSRRFPMTTYIILSRFSPQAFNDSRDFKALAEQASTKIREQCPAWCGRAALPRWGVLMLWTSSKRKIPSNWRGRPCSSVLTGIRPRRRCLPRRGRSSWLRFEVPWSDAHATRAGQRGWGSIVLAEGSGLFKLSEPKHRIGSAGRDVCIAHDRPDTFRSAGPGLCPRLKKRNVG